MIEIFKFCLHYYSVTATANTATLVFYFQKSFFNKKVKQFIEDIWKYLFTPLHLPNPSFFSLNTKLTYREKPQKTTYRPEALCPVQKEDIQQAMSWEPSQNSATFAGLGCITV